MWFLSLCLYASLLWGKHKTMGHGGTFAYLSPDALVLFSLEEVKQHLQEGWILAVRLNHIACASYLLAQCPQSHLVESQETIVTSCHQQGFFFFNKSISLYPKPSSESVSSRVTKNSSQNIRIWSFVPFIPVAWPVTRSPAACPWWLGKAHPSTSSSLGRSPDGTDTEPTENAEMSIYCQIPWSQRRGALRPYPAAANTDELKHTKLQ